MRCRRSSVNRPKIDRPSIVILHIDMDAFFAAIEQRDNPALRGRPVVVGGRGGRGVVAAASYEARRFGIHSAMAGRRAAALCPDAVFIHSRIDHYVEVGRQVREIFHRYTPLVQPLSSDEAFLDVSGTVALFGQAAQIGRSIKDDIQRELHLTASVGVAPIKFVAKIASDLNKPDGFVEVAPDGVLDFLDPLPVSRLWGVGKVGQAKLRRWGLNQMVDIRQKPLEQMRQAFGSWGEHLWRLANGIDPRQVVPDRHAKQISHERTFAEDISDLDMLSAVVSFLGEQVCRRLRRNDRLCRSVTLKYRREDFRTFARTRTMPNETDSTDAVVQCARELLIEMRGRQPRPVRLIGVSIGSLCDKNAAQQMSLFDTRPAESAMRKVDPIIDQLQEKIGPDALYRGTSHQWVEQRRKQKTDRENAYEPPPEDL